MMLVEENRTPGDEGQRGCSLLHPRSLCGAHHTFGMSLGIRVPCWMVSPMWAETMLAMFNAISSVLTQSLRSNMGMLNRWVNK